MAVTMDMSDVPAVTVEDLTFAFERLVARGRGLALINGIQEADLREVESEIWRKFEGDAVRRLAVAQRLRSVLHVFSSRRLRALFLETGFGMIAPAAEIAAKQRLNGTWGFNPQKFLMALAARLEAKNAREKLVSVFDAREIRLAA